MMPVCVKCRKFFRAERNGVTVEEGMPGGSRFPNADPASGWGSYKLWKADKYKCPGCGHEIIGGWAHEPWAEHYQPDYEKRKKANPPDIFVPDCC